VTAKALWTRVYQERRRVVVPMLILLVGNVAVLGLAVWPLQANVTGQQSVLIDTNYALAQARRLDRQVRDARTSRDRAEQDLAKFYAEVLPRDLATAQRTTNLWLNEAALDAGLLFRGSSFNWAEVRDSRLTRAFSRVTLRGRYADIRRFLYAIETAQEFIVVEGVELAQSGSASGGDGMLEVSMLVSTFYMTPSRS
jgi:Tfp pilus assembly protein PilO